MTFNPDIHHRQSIRLKGHDYSQPGAYFITIGAHQRQALFGHITDGIMSMNAAGLMVEKCWRAIPDHFPLVQLAEFIVMPNHVHGILVIHEGRGTACRAPTDRAPTMESFGQPVQGSIPTIIRSFKSASTATINRDANTLGSRLWQRNYYEHIIRNEQSFCRISEYIRTNPQTWQEDIYHDKLA